MNSKLFTRLALVLSLLVLPASFVLAQDAKYVALIEIPGLGDGDLDFGTYINALYALSISVAALMAVIKIIIAGVKYMLSDVVTQKGDAINDIRSSVLGLIVVISAVLILTVINPNLAKTEIFMDPVRVTAKTPTGAVGAVDTSNAGYKAVPRSAQNATFQADCTATGGRPGLAMDPKVGGVQVCYDPIPPATNQAIDSLFGASTGRDMEPIKRRWQEGIIPRALADTSTIQTDESVSRENVLIAVTVKNLEEQNWVDRNNLKDMPTNCLDLRRATGKNVVLVGSVNKGYLACVVKP